MIILPDQVNTALAMLDAAGYEAYLVGGAVRDYVRGNHMAKDWDIATNALPNEVEEVFAGFRLIETGLKHGTVTVLIDREPLEITTYRVDGPYTDHRRPDTVSFTRSLQEDLKRRDFTMNALAYSPKTGIVDFTGGLEDIDRGLVRCVGDPERRFQEDGLRILRAVRFASVFGMRVEENTAAAVHRNKKLLCAIAAERIQTELTKTLCGNGVREVLQEFADVIAIPLPEIIPMFGFDQCNPYHNQDVWNHTVTVVSSAPASSVLRWAALLHDIGKPSCFSMAEDGIGHFYGHAEKSMELAKEILIRLRFDAAGRERITTLIRYHDLPIAAEKKRVRRLMSKLGVDTVRQLIELHKADTYGQSETCLGRIAEYQQVKDVLEEILQEESCFSLRDLAVDGNDMIAIGLKGKSIGAALKDCLNAVIEEQVSNERAALIAYIDEKYVSHGE